MVDFIKMSKVWSLCMEFYGALHHRTPCILAMHHRTPYIRTNGHFYKINGKSQNVHTADLGYLGFQDYLKKFAALYHQN